MTFKQLKVGEHFEFSKKTKVGNGIFNLVGVKKTDNEYRMGGLNRLIGNSNVEIIQTDKPLN